jgi:hypothetical protein
MWFLLSSISRRLLILLLLFVILESAKSVTIRPVSHAPRKWKGGSPITSAEHLLESSCPREHKRSAGIIKSSFQDFSTEEPIHPSKNGFIYSAIDAYSYHHHLTLRPEDIWFSILTQLGFFVNGHAEEVRDYFVSHKGKIELEVFGGGNIKTADFGDLAIQITDKIAENVKDPELRDWFMPDFSTTVQSDRVVAAVQLMGAMQKYFNYKMTLLCGIPSVTLLGDRDDWQRILQRLEMLPRLGTQPAQFSCLLKPILQHFVMSFDDPSNPAVLEFWGKIAHYQMGSGSSSLSGWITAFSFWDNQGNPLYHPPAKSVCELDGTLQNYVDMDDISNGFVSVPVKVDDNGIIYCTKMVAGSVGIRVTSSGDLLDEGERHDGTGFLYLGPNGELTQETMDTVLGRHSGPDSLQPLSGWWMYELVNGANGTSCQWEREEAQEEKRRGTFD